MADNTILPGTLNRLSAQEKFKSEPKSNELGQKAFLKLMITQMENQNPLEPQANSEFVAQLAQFSSVEGIEKMNTSMDSLVGSFRSNQALQASSLVGRRVTVATDYARLTEDGQIRGTFNAPAKTGKVTLEVYSASGKLVATEALGAQPAGESEFVWDGLDDDGNALSAGGYQFKVMATYGEKTLQLGTQMQANVDSVTVGTNGSLTLNVDGVGPVSLSKVRNII